MVVRPVEPMLQQAQKILIRGLGLLEAVSFTVTEVWVEEVSRMPDGSEFQGLQHQNDGRQRYTPCLKKLCKLIFCQNFIKFQPIV